MLILATVTIASRLCASPIEFYCYHSWSDRRIESSSFKVCVSALPERGRHLRKCHWRFIAERFYDWCSTDVNLILKIRDLVLQLYVVAYEVNISFRGIIMLGMSKRVLSRWMACTMVNGLHPYVPSDSNCIGLVLCAHHLFSWNSKNQPNVAMLLARLSQ